jgi:uroporphyrinogen decarboxylase
MYEHKEADRIPFVDGPWATTVARWQQEGLPAGTDFRDYFDLDKVVLFKVDNSPQYDIQIVEDTPEYRTTTTPWGVTFRNFKQRTTTPETMANRINTPDSWLKAKARMIPTRDRISWDGLKRHYGNWCKEGYWKTLKLFFGFDVTHSQVVGTETLLIAMAEEPDWCVDMFNHFLDVNIKLLDMVLDEGYQFDSIFWCDDMGYKFNQFFSLKMYRELLKPVHQRAIEWAHGRGMKAYLHSCGNINPFVPDLIKIGLDALNPLEVKAGMDPVNLKNKYGKDLLFHGGINALLWDDYPAISEIIRETVPKMKANGGYIFGSDHSIPDSVSFEEFKQIVALVKEIGLYR